MFNPMFRNKVDSKTKGAIGIFAVLIVGAFAISAGIGQFGITGAATTDVESTGFALWPMVAALGIIVVALVGTYGAWRYKKKKS
tara:strand:+ start:168 stop:419 length:252 start_codon:yes stop_codon:yes gene_type:complete